MKQVKYSVLILIHCFSFFLIQAQQDSQYTQYMYNTSAINPAYAGNRGVLSINSIYRAQWVGLNGAPETMQGSINSPVGSNVGLGFSFINDKIGPSQETTINADFSYTINTSLDTKLSFGIKAGLNALDVNFNELDPTNRDPNAVNINNRISPSIGVGFYLHAHNWYIGLSSPNLLKTDHYRDNAIQSGISEEVSAYLIGGYVFDLSESTKFKPAILVKGVTGAPLALDLTANFLFHEKFTLGAAYRLDAAVSALVGFQISDKLMLGYAYDYDTNNLGNFNSGSHEIFLRFELISNVKRSINPRFF